MNCHTLRLASLFTDHAVLQRNLPVPVWGWMKPCARVRISLGEVCGQSLSGADGKFMVRLPRMEAGGPYEMRVNSLDDGQSLLVRDVMIGEVWLASGQSNMQWNMANLGLDERDVEPNDSIREIRVPNTAYAGRQSEFSGAWELADGEHISQFSAVAHFFARHLQRELGVAIGIINSSWGGTIVEAWMNRESLCRNPDTAAWLDSYENVTHSEEFWRDFADLDLSNPSKRQRAVNIEEVYSADPGNGAFDCGWADSDFDDREWDRLELPCAWTRVPGYQHSGVVWFRREIDIPERWAGKELMLGLGAVDKQDITYFNGVQVGATGQAFEDAYWSVPRQYTIPGEMVKVGRNVVAVRAYSFAYDGGLIGPKKKMLLHPADQPEDALPLSGIWRFDVEHDLGCNNTTNPGITPGPGAPNSPGILYDNMIAPLLPCALRGVIWYQGESNANLGFSVDAIKYRQAIVDLIRSWRLAWGQGDFPFLQVQLANFMEPQGFQAESLWALLRDSQRLALEEPNTGLAVTIDIGEANNIHPFNKQDVGERLAQWALAKTYGKAIVPSGPLYKSIEHQGSTLRIHFDHVGSGLMAKGIGLKTFYIAGQDKVFLPADAWIRGDQVILSHPDIPAPIAARYAWANNPEGCNLYNLEGLPASPFRTDTW